jgi:hypothetical protein
MLKYSVLDTSSPLPIPLTFKTRMTARLGGAVTVGAPLFLPMAGADRLVLAWVVAALLSALLVVRVGDQDLRHIGRRRFTLAAAAAALAGVTALMVGRVLLAPDAPGPFALFHRTGLRHVVLFGIRQAPAICAAILASRGSRLLRRVLHRYRLSQVFRSDRVRQPLPAVEPVLGDLLADADFVAVPPLVPVAFEMPLPASASGYSRRVASPRHHGTMSSVPAALSRSAPPPVRRYGRPPHIARALPAFRHDGAMPPSARAPRAYR